MSLLNACVSLEQRSNRSSMNNERRDSADSINRRSGCDNGAREMEGRGRIGLAEFYE